MRLRLPLVGEWPVSTPYGEDGHMAIDYACPEGTKVLASHSGIVIYEHTDQGGIVARVTGAECYTRYAHLLGYWVTNGAQVNASDQIAVSGNTGTATTGPHLHFAAYRLNGTPFDPTPYMGEEAKVSIGSYQFQGGAAAWMRQHVQASGATMIKQIQPDYNDISWFAGDIIGRLWWDNEPDKALVWEGAAGAIKWWNMAQPRIAKCPGIKLWECPNEVAIWDGATANLWCDFELKRIAILHANVLKAVSGCTSTGRWESWVYPHLFNVFTVTDYWEVHEYGMRAMTPDGWHLLRYRKVIAQLKAAGVRVPPFIIGETGIDYSGNPNTDGWKAQGITAAQYAAQLNAYLLECAKDPEVVCVTPFVWSHQGWPSFEMDEAVSSLYTNYVKNLQPVPPPHEGLPTDETSTNPKILVQKSRWWLEEMQRQYEAGKLDYANRIRLSLIDLMYRAENSL